ncbi:MAG: hypothetical protein IBX64_01250 [Actinobacteria bacterium]|nr:hypothetical protein [Actinomycetota bacterium]
MKRLDLLRWGGSGGTWRATCKATGETLLVKGAKSPEKGRPYNRQTGKWVENGKRVAEGLVVARDGTYLPTKSTAMSKSPRKAANSVLYHTDMVEILWHHRETRRKRRKQTST